MGPSVMLFAVGVLAIPNERSGRLINAVACDAAWDKTWKVQADIQLQPMEV